MVCKQDLSPIYKINVYQYVVLADLKSSEGRCGGGKVCT